MTNEHDGRPNNFLTQADRAQAKRAQELLDKAKETEEDERVQAVRRDMTEDLDRVKQMYHDAKREVEIKENRLQVVRKHDAEVTELYAASTKQLIEWRAKYDEWRSELTNNNNKANAELFNQLEEVRGELNAKRESEEHLINELNALHAQRGCLDKTLREQHVSLGKQDDELQVLNRERTHLRALLDAHMVFARNAITL